MGNVEIYRKTLRFSVMRLLVTILGIFIIVALPLATFLITAGMSEVACAVATFVAFIVGIVVFALIIRYCGYLFTAAQVAMITEGVSKGRFPTTCTRPASRRSSAASSRPACTSPCGASPRRSPTRSRRASTPSVASRTPATTPVPRPRWPASSPR